MSSPLTTGQAKTALAELLWGHPFRKWAPLSHPSLEMKAWVHPLTFRDLTELGPADLDPTGRLTFKRTGPQSLLLRLNQEGVGVTEVEVTYGPKKLCGQISTLYYRAVPRGAFRLVPRCEVKQGLPAPEEKTPPAVWDTIEPFFRDYLFRSTYTDREGYYKQWMVPPERAGRARLFDDDAITQKFLDRHHT